MRSRVGQSIVVGLEPSLPYVKSLPRRGVSSIPLKGQRNFSGLLTWKIRIKTHTSMENGLL